jgi:hypothetical protein
MPGEQCFDPRQRAADRMPPAGWLTAPRQGHINRLTCQPRIQRRRFQRRLAHGQRDFQRLLGVVDGLTRLTALFRRQPAQFLEALGQHPFLAQIMHPPMIQCRQIARFGNGDLSSFDKLGQCVHAG